MQISIFCLGISLIQNKCKTNICIGDLTGHGILQEASWGLFSRHLFNILRQKICARGALSWRGGGKRSTLVEGGVVE